MAVDTQISNDTAPPQTGGDSTALSPADASKLVGIIQKMNENKEPEGNIQRMVTLYKQHFGKPVSAPLPGEGSYQPYQPQQQNPIPQANTPQFGLTPEEQLANKADASDQLLQDVRAQHGETAIQNMANQAMHKEIQYKVGQAMDLFPKASSTSVKQPASAAALQFPNTQSDTDPATTRLPGVVQPIVDQYMDPETGFGASVKINEANDPTGGTTKSILHQIQQDNPALAPQIQSAAYVAGGRNRPDKAGTIMDNAAAIEKGDLKYDIRSDQLLKPEGFFPSLAHSFEKRNQDLDDADIYMNGNRQQILNRLEAAYADHDPDKPVGVPEGTWGKLGSTIGDQGPVTAEGILAGAAGSIGGSFVGNPELGPVLAAAVTTPEFMARSYKNSLEQNFIKARQSGMSAEQALDAAQPVATRTSALDGAQAAAMSVVGAKLGFTETPEAAGAVSEASPSYLAAAQKVLKKIPTFAKDVTTESGVMGGMGAAVQGLKNINEGKPTDEGVGDAFWGTAAFTGVMGAIAKGLGTVVNSAKDYNALKMGAAKAPQPVIDAALGDLLTTGQLTPAEVVHARVELKDQKAADAALPELDEATQQKVQDLINKRDVQQKLMDDPSNVKYKPEFKSSIDAINEQIEGLKAQPKPDELVQKAQDIIAQDKIPGTQGVIAKQAAEDPAALQEHLKEIAEQSYDPGSAANTRKTYDGLVNIAQEMYPIESLPHMENMHSLTIDQGQVSHEPISPAIEPNKAFNTIDYGDYADGNTPETPMARASIAKDIEAGDVPIGNTGETFNDFKPRIIEPFQKVLETEAPNTAIVTSSSVLKGLTTWDDMGRPDINNLTPEQSKEFADKYNDESVDPGEMVSFDKVKGDPSQGQIHVIRHGETDANETGTFRTDESNLTQAGISEAENAGAKLKDQLAGSQPPKIISSDLPRTIHTSNLVYGVASGIERDPRAVEVSNEAEPNQAHEALQGSYDRLLASGAKPDDPDMVKMKEEVAVLKKKTTNLPENVQNGTGKSNLLRERTQANPGINRQTEANDSREYTEGHLRAVRNWLEAVERNDPKAIRDAAEEFVGTSAQDKTGGKPVLLGDIDAGGNAIRTPGNNGENAGEETPEVGTRPSQESRQSGQRGGKSDVDQSQRSHETPQSGKDTGGEKETGRTNGGLTETERRKVVNAISALSKVSTDEQRVRGARYVQQMLAKGLEGSEKTKQIIDLLYNKILSYATEIKGPDALDVRQQAENGETMGVGDTEHPEPAPAGGEPNQQRPDTGNAAAEPASPTNDTSEGAPQGKTADEEKGNAPSANDQVRATLEKAPNPVTGIRNVITEKRIQEMGLEPFEEQAAREWGPVWDKAKEKINNGYDIQKLIDDKEAHPEKGLTDEEAALLTLHQVRKESEYENAVNDIIRGKADNDPKKVEEAEITLASTKDALQQLYNVTKETGREAARGFNARKMLSDRRYTLVRMNMEKQAAKGGDSLTPEEEATVKQQFEDIKAKNAAYEKRISDLEEENKQLKADQAIKDAKKAAPKTSKTHEDYVADRQKILDDIREKLKKSRGEAGATVIPYAKELFAIAPDVGKLVKSLVEEGVDKLPDLINSVHDTLKDAIDGLTKKDVRDLIAGEYNQPAKDLSPDQVKLRDLKMQATLLNKLESLQAGEEKAAGKEPVEYSQEVKDLRQQIRDFQDAQKPPKQGRQPQSDASRLASYKKNLTKQISDLEARTQAKDFSAKAKANPIPLDEEAMKLKGDLERAKDAYEKALKQDMLKNRSTYEKILSGFVDVERAGKLSSPVTIGKLASAAFTRLGLEPIEEGIGAAYSAALPKEFNAKALGEANFNGKALATGYRKAITKGMEDSWKNLKNQRSDLQATFGKSGELPSSAINYLGQLHGATKAPVKRFAFERSLQKQLENAVKYNVDASDPMVMTSILNRAYKASQRAIFMQDNAVANFWSKHVASEAATGKTVSSIAKWLIPFVKIPTNIIGEVGSYVGGAEYGAAKLAYTAITKGLKNVSEDEAEMILRNLKKGTLGTAALLLGYFNPENFGGFYQKGQQKKEDEPGWMGARIFGQNIPGWMMESPIFQTMNLGATARKLADTYVKKDKATEGVWKGSGAALLGLAEEEPLLEQPAQLFNAITKPKEGMYYLGEVAKSTIDPAIVNNIATWTDPADKRSFLDQLAKSETIRKPTTVAEHVEMGIPGLRENVPLKKGKGSNNPPNNQ